MNLVCLHFQSRAEFFINPVFIEHMEWMPAERMTAVSMNARNGGYKCVETPDEIQVLIDKALSSPQAVLAGTPVVGGVGGQGPVYGDGTAVESRGGGNVDSVGGSGGDDTGGPRVHGLAPKSQSEIPPPWQSGSS